jgi:ATP-dependent Clp protease ATP-binding subunit ClpA
MRFLGRKWDEVTEEVKIVSYKVAKGLNHAVRFEIRGEREGRSQLLREAVIDDEIAEVVARWTSIPIPRPLGGEREKLLRLDKVLHERVIGRDEAVGLVADAVIRARSGVKDPRRPTGSFIFLGPTGVGKTELSRALAEALFDSEDKMPERRPHRAPSATHREESAHGA